MEEIEILIKKAKSLYHKEWADKNREHLKEYNRTWRNNNKDKVKDAHNRYWLKKAKELLNENA